MPLGLRPMTCKQQIAVSLFQCLGALIGTLIVTSHFLFGFGKM